MNNKVKIGDGNKIKKSNLGVNSVTKNKKENWLKTIFLGVLASIIAAILITLWTKYNGS